MFHRTERLFLRPAWPEDWEDIYRGMADQQVVMNLASAPWPYTAADARSFASREQDGFLPSFVVTLPEAGLIGGAGIGMDDDTGDVQLGYWIAREWWGKGFATEAARSLLQIAGALGHKRITASHFIDNPASGKVLRKAGFTPTGRIRPGYSLARGRRDPVACFEAKLDGDDDIGPQDMKQAA